MVHIKTELKKQGDDSILEVSGAYGIGSDGNDDAAAIVAALRDVLQGHQDAKVTLDLSRMKYAFGDAIGQVFVLFSEDDVAYILSNACRGAWEGLLSLMPTVSDELGPAIQYR